MAPQRLGQHFLTGQAILERIASAACPEHESLVIEIGPGKGALTRHLLPRTDRVVAVEIDTALAGRLRAGFSAESRLEVVEADVLATDLNQWGPAVVAGNLPYYITSPIVERVCGLGSNLLRAILMVQKEVAERIVAGPGTRDYGMLSLQAQISTTAEILFTVPPKAFSPPPKVDSAVVRLTPKPEPEVQDRPGFLEFAGRCFRQKRKTLRNNLIGYYGRERIESWPEASRRAEQLSIPQLAELYRRVKT